MAIAGSALKPRPPPVALVALSLIVGSASYAVLDRFFPPALSFALLCLPILTWLRPDFLRIHPTGGESQASIDTLPESPTITNARTVSTALCWVVMAGALMSHAEDRAAGGDCRLQMPDGARGPVVGWFEGGAGTGTRPFRLLRGLGCSGSVRALVREGGSSPLPGIPVRAEGTWRRAAHAVTTAPASAGTLLLTEVRADESATGPTLRGSPGTPTGTGRVTDA